MNADHLEGQAAGCSSVRERRSAALQDLSLLERHVMLALLQNDDTTRPTTPLSSKPDQTNRKIALRRINFLRIVN